MLMHRALMQRQAAAASKADLPSLLGGDVSNQGLGASDSPDGHQVNAQNQAADWHVPDGHLEPATFTSASIWVSRLRTGVSMLG